MAAHRPSELAWFLTAFHQRENPSLTSREDSLALRLKSLWSIVSPYSCHKREGRSLIKNAAAASGRMWDASPGNGAASFEPRVTLNWAAIKSQADLPVSCSSLPPAVGRSVCLGWLLLESPFSLSHLAALLSSGIFATGGTARKESGLLLLSLFPSSIFCGDLAKFCQFRKSAGFFFFFYFKNWTNSVNKNPLKIDKSSIEKVECTSVYFVRKFYVPVIVSGITKAFSVRKPSSRCVGTFLCSFQKASR